MIPRRILFFLCSLLLFFSCKKKETSKVEESPPFPVVACQPLYTKDIKPFIISKCALGGCHVSGAGIGDFNQYAPLKQRVDNGRVQSLVFDLKIMPPASSVKLTQGELDALKCWMNNGAADN